VHDDGSTQSGVEKNTYMNAHGLPSTAASSAYAPAVDFGSVMDRIYVFQSTVIRTRSSAGIV
jgi:hypothetical protein